MREYQVAAIENLCVGSNAIDCSEFDVGFIKDVNTTPLGTVLVFKFLIPVVKIVSNEDNSDSETLAAKHSQIVDRFSYALYLC